MGTRAVQVRRAHSHMYSQLRSSSVQACPVSSSICSLTWRKSASFSPRRSERSTTPELNGLATVHTQTRGDRSRMSELRNGHRLSRTLERAASACERHFEAYAAQTQAPLDSQLRQAPIFASAALRPAARQPAPPTDALQVACLRCHPD